MKYSRILAIAIVPLLALTAGCSDEGNTGPDVKRLSGVYHLSDWLYVWRGDTLAITEDSYVRLSFVDDEHVKGEGYVWLLVPTLSQENGLEYKRQPVLGSQDRNGEVQPITLEGWYYILEGSGQDTLRFRFARDAGAGTWLESFDWVLNSDWSSYTARIEDAYGVLQIVHSQE